jgi:hypothetical protein
VSLGAAQAAKDDAGRFLTVAPPTAAFVERSAHVVPSSPAHTAVAASAASSDVMTAALPLDVALPVALALPFAVALLLAFGSFCLAAAV